MVKADYKEKTEFTNNASYLADGHLRFNCKIRQSNTKLTPSNINNSNYKRCNPILNNKSQKQYNHIKIHPINNDRLNNSNNKQKKVVFFYYRIGSYYIYSTLSILILSLLY